MASSDDKRRNFSTIRCKKAILNSGKLMRGAMLDTNCAMLETNINKIKLTS